MDLATITAIWRYPVKSLAAEPMDTTRLDATGLPGDRERALFVRSGNLARTGKTYRGKEHNLLHTTHDTATAVALSHERGVEVEVRRDPSERFFDAAPVSLVLDTWIAEVEAHLDIPLDPRRWRPNLYARALAANVREGDLLGASLRIGSAELEVIDSIKRCVTTTYDIATGERDDDVLLYVAQRRANVMGVYCAVTSPGSAAVGDFIEVRA